MDSMLKDLFFLFFSPLAWLHLPVEYPFRVFRGTFIASLDTLTISPVICKYIHEKERERECVLERTASIVEKQVFFPFTELDKQQQRYLNGSSSQLPPCTSSSSSLDERLTWRAALPYHLSFNPLPFAPCAGRCKRCSFNSLFRASSSNDRLTNRWRPREKYSLFSFRSVNSIEKFSTGKEDNGWRINRWFTPLVMLVTTWSMI